MEGIAPLCLSRWGKCYHPFYKKKINQKKDTVINTSILEQESTKNLGFRLLGNPPECRRLSGQSKETKQNTLFE